LLARFGYAGFVLGQAGQLEPVDAEGLASLQKVASGSLACGPVNNVIFLPQGER